MKVAWKDFAQRRKLNLSMFGKMSYESYTEWCRVRSVEPVSRESFEGARNLIETSSLIPDEITTVPTPELDEKQLKKLRKPSLVNLCKKHSIVLSGDETKNRLVRLLLLLNNND